jgi:hypothetical protein
MTIKKIVIDCLTGKDNQTFDISRIALALSLVVYLSLAIADVAMTHDFEYQQFGIGLGAVLAAGGLGINLKRRTEP